MVDTDDRLPDRPGGDDPGRGRRLGVDVGTVRIGVAASDPDGILATPVETVERDRRNKTDKHVRRLAQLAETYRHSLRGLDINPLLVLDAGRGVVAVDWLIEFA